MTVDMTRSPDTAHAGLCPENQGRRPGTLEKRRKLSGKPQSPGLAATADSPKGADPAEAGQAVADETGETVALATILTMVKKLDQN
jgi:hypothetical protein